MVIGAACVGVVVCLVLTLLTAQGRAQTRQNENAIQQAQAATAGAQAASVELTTRLGLVTAQATALQRQVDDNTALLTLSIAERDRVRTELALLQINLTSLQANLDGVFATVLKQGDTMVQLDTCLKAVSQALNLAAINSDALAIDILFSNLDACTQSSAAVDAARNAG